MGMPLPFCGATLRPRSESAVAVVARLGARDDAIAASGRRTRRVAAVPVHRIAIVTRLVVGRVDQIVATEHRHSSGRLAVCATHGALRHAAGARVDLGVSVVTAPARGLVHDSISAEGNGPGGRADTWRRRPRTPALHRCARPAVRLQRLRETQDGRYAHELKYPSLGRTHIVLTPTKLLARLSLLVAPPRYPLVRHGGLFAPARAWRALRKAIVSRAPGPPREQGGCRAREGGDAQEAKAGKEATAATPERTQSPSPTRADAGLARALLAGEAEGSADPMPVYA
jgi:hypothetical protein